MEQLYREEIIELYKNPQHKRILPDADITHSGANVTCGDHVRIYVKVRDGKIDEVSFQGEGCAISMAASELLSELVREKSFKEVLTFGKKEISEWLGVELGPSRIKCGLLALETLQEGIRRHLS